MRESALIKIVDIAKDNYISEPLIVGGVPRDLYLGAGDSSDLDLTTNDADCPRLGVTVAIDAGVRFKVFPDGHVSLYYPHGAVDFSGNFISSGAVDFASNNYSRFKDGDKEVYSRDFTINTLHKKLLSNDIMDITGLAVPDLEKKIIRTIVPPEISFGDDLRRLFRAINFSARLGFDIDGDIVDFSLQNIGNIYLEMGKSLRDAFVTNIVSKSIILNADKTMGYIIDMGLLPLIPLVGEFKDELIKRRLIASYLDGSSNLRGAAAKT